MIIDDDKKIILHMIAIKSMHYLSWDMICKNIGVCRSTLHRIINTNDKTSMTTMRKIKAFVDTYNGEGTK